MNEIIHSFEGVFTAILNAAVVIVVVFVFRGIGKIGDIEIVEFHDFPFHAGLLMPDTLPA